MTLRTTLLRASLLAALCFSSAQLWAGPSLDKYIASVSAQIAAEPNNPAHYLRRALVHSDAGHRKAAFRDVAQAEKVGGKTAETYTTRGVLNYRIGKRQVALQALDQALLMVPEHVRALSYRARLLRDLGKAPEALADYRQLIRLNPNTDVGHYLSAAELMRKLPQHGPDAALALLDQRIAQLGAIPQLQRLAIRIDTERGNTAEVIRRLQTLDATSKASPHWHLEMADALRQNCELKRVNPHLVAAESGLAGRRNTGANTRLRQQLAALKQATEPARCQKQP